MAVFSFHFYMTYNSDVLEHYYTLREAAQYLQLFLQAPLLSLAVGQPLVALTLIPLELIWLSFNYILYRYGSGYTLRAFIKFCVCTVAIISGLLFLCLL